MIDPQDPPTASVPTGVTRAAYFVSDSTGVTAETLGNALLANFPSIAFDRRTIPFIDTEAEALKVVAEIDAAVRLGSEPIIFTTVKRAALREILGSTSATTIDLLAGHLTQLEATLHTTASEQLGQYHGVGNMHAYLARMRAIEYAIEHDDGQSKRGLDQAAVIIIAPSRCGKTPTTMYLAMQYGLLVANYPLTDDDFPADELPEAIRAETRRCFGLTSTPMRLSQVRQQRRPNSRYASLDTCSMEIRRAEDLYRRNRVPFLNSSTKSVEEMSAVIMQTLKLRDGTRSFGGS